jgi:hypothetical protein
MNLIRSDPIPSLGFPCIFVIAVSLFIFLPFPLLNIELFRRDYGCFQRILLPWPSTGNEPNNTVVAAPQGFLVLLWVIEVLLFVRFSLLHACWNVTSCRLVGECLSVEGTAATLRVEVRRVRSQLVWKNCVEDGHCLPFQIYCSRVGREKGYCLLGDAGMIWIYYDYFCYSLLSVCGPCIHADWTLEWCGLSCTGRWTSGHRIPNLPSGRSMTIGQTF